jgi:hypothetical protein
LKACGVVTAADAKRNRFMREILTDFSACRLVLRVGFVVPLTQFIDQVLKMG